ncbi:MAG: IS200/IS605 family transposase [Patescibacteria group bacterium]|nr:IS200/IS605 family transposase [Patescibacteria group bacterium]
MQKPIFWRGGHTIHRCLYHLVFVPKYRRKVLRRELVRRLTHLFYECCKVNRWYIHELSIQTDHVHMLIQLPPRTYTPKAIQYLKGGTSRVIRKEFPELEEFLWGDSLWADGYFIETVGRAAETAMRKYIREQWKQEPGASRGL